MIMEGGKMTETMAVEIPADVKDNSETVTDYAFRRDMSGHGWAHGYMAREEALMWAGVHGYDTYTWDDVNPGPDGQRCRFDMLVRRDTGQVVNLFHTEYFTRVPCYQGEWCSSYATHYVVTTGGTLPVSDPVPVCDHHIDGLRKSFADSPVTLHLSERLLIGQHD
jgi:hypothetical protein